MPEVPPRAARRSPLSPRRVSCALLLALFGPLACAAIDEDGLAPLGELGQEVVTKGNWSLYGNGQCVVGARTFYDKRFGVTLSATGVQGSSIGACKYLGACMYWVSPKVRPSSAKWNRYAWGSVMPQTYDLIIYPPTASNGYGHVASVDHMEGNDKNAYKNLYMMDSNFLSHEKKSAYIHTYNLKPYGFYRLKSLDGCKPRCDGKSVVDKNCKATKCGDPSATCVSDGLGPHCVHKGCPASGSGTICDGKKVLACKNGAVSTKEDCSKDGSSCTKDKLGPHCVYPGCPSTGKGEACGDNRVVTCNNGDVTAKSDCDEEDAKCVEDAAGPHCVFPGCPSTGKGTFCEDKKTVSTCSDGKVVAREDCSKTGSTCVKDALGPHCVFPGCPSSGAATICDDDGAVVTCQDGKVTQRDDCAKNAQVCSVTGELRCDAPPKGAFDAPGCETLGGWAFDPSALDTAIDIDFVFDEADDATADDDTPTLTLTDRADGTRPSSCGDGSATGCDHAFAVPTPRSLLDGLPHEIQAFGLDATGGPRTPLTPEKQTITCPVPTPTGVLRSLGNPETWTNWAFSEQQDVAKMAPDPAKFSPSTYDEGPDLPMAPSFVRGDGADATVFSIDTGVKRRVVDAGSLRAWRQVVGSMPAAELAKLPQGADLPTRPRLWEGEDGALWLEDVPFLPAGVSGTNTGTEEGDDPPALSEGQPAGTAGAKEAPTGSPTGAESESSCALGMVGGAARGRLDGALTLSAALGIFLAERRRRRRPTGI